MQLNTDHVASAGSWESLTPALRNSTLTTLSRLEFSSMTPVQSATVPLFLSNKDVVVEAVTGSGKTLAYLLPIIEILLKRTDPLKAHEIGAIVISPTRELSRQISSVLASFLADIEDSRKLRQLLVTGGSNPEEDIKAYRESGANIIIATPGKLESLIKSNEFHTKELEILVLDEADRLLDLGFEQSLRSIIGHLPKQRRTGLFSATMTDGLSELARAGLRNPVRVMVKVEDMETKEVQRIPSTLCVSYVMCESNQKLLHVLGMLMADPSRKFIMYFSTCLCVDYFFKILSNLPFLKDLMPFFSIHGKMDEKRRQAVYQNFNDADNGVLICTDVAARGLDMPDIDCVIQFDPPQDPQAFLHRCGRTARQGRSGEALVLIHPQEDAYLEFLRIRKVPIDEGRYQPFEIPDLPSISMPVDIYLPARQTNASSGQNMITIEKPTLTQYIHWLQIGDRDIYLKSITAFVSFLRSYQEHQLKYIFQFSKLNLISLMASFFLLRRPACPELKKIKLKVLDADDTAAVDYLKSSDRDTTCFINCLSESALESIKYKDKTREKMRQINIAKEKKNTYTKREISWSKVKEQKERKVERKLKKERKREAIARAKIEAVESKKRDASLVAEVDDEWRELQRERKQAKKMAKISTE
eukprot:Partr_v1_DN28201_c1_g1_i2_m76226 putative ATP-binding RNA helicase involved in the biogenesis of 60S ribosomal subunits. Required for the normal formation of 18S rRNA through the processing of pre-rRNAs at sites A0, A1 and A2, and the normal formation of 25S and 5.8S rRNAs through the processing of pre-rRNAs at sites C1 and C2 (By similarity)